MPGSQPSIVVVLTLALFALGSCSGDCAQGETTTTDTGLQYTDVTCGEGPEATRGDLLTLHYTGSLQGGATFDSSHDRGEPIDVRLGFSQLIAGFSEGLYGMREGGERELVIPPELGYGVSGSPPDIPPSSTLVFQIELLDIDPD